MMTSAYPGLPANGLGAGEVSVGDLVAATGLSFGNVSAHLGLLRLARVVTSRREGQRVYYRVGSPFAAALLRRVRGG
jgi:ArsR family transcriptional regulator